MVNFFILLKPFSLSLIGHQIEILFNPLKISVVGNAQVILSVLLNIIRHHVIDSISDPLHGREGIELLEYWAQEVVGMSGHLFCSEFVTTHIESYGNLEKLAIHLKIEVPPYLG